MPRSTTRGKLKAEVLTNSLIASARNINLRKTAQPTAIKQQEWQERAWYWYDTIEVFHYAVQWVGNTLSRAKLLVLENGETTANQAALDALESFFGGSDQHGEFLRQSGIHMTVTGEYYTIGVEVDGEDEWRVAAAVEVKVSPEGYKVEGVEVDDDGAFIMRSWRPHPRKINISDCPTRPLLPILSQLDELTKYVSAQIDSRLSGAGLLLLPLEISFPTPAEGADGTQQTGLDNFMSELTTTMSLAKADRGSAAAQTPIGIQAPGEMLDKIQHLTFWSELDEHTVELRKEAIHRLALGLDMPPEALEGTGESNHWSAWQVEDSLIKSHSEPLLALICAAVTEGYLRVILEEGGMSPEDAATFTIGADTADMRLRPNRSKEALELGDRLLLSNEAIRRENGFTETDAPSEDEVKHSLLLKLAQGSPDTSAVRAAARQLGVDLGEDPALDAAPGERPLPRSLEEHPTQDIPDTRDAEAAALLAAAEGAVFRALERAGNKLKSTMTQMQGLPDGLRAVERYRYVKLSKVGLDGVLEDAWGNLDLLSLSGGKTLAQYETHLDNYVRMLISSRSPYDRSLLATYLNLVDGE